MDKRDNNLLVLNYLGLKIVDLEGAVVYVVLAFALGHEKGMMIGVVCPTVNVDEASDCNVPLIRTRDHQHI